jgi:phenylalanyl-tRNA synthetase beta chain
VELLSLRDEVLDIAVTPDRGYALSVRGVAREAATAFGLELADPAQVPVPDADADGYPVRVEDPDGCDRYVARVVRGLDPAATSPAWLQRRLVLAGMRPISLAVDVTNHVMLEHGQPLHAFDLDALSGDVVVRRQRRGSGSRRSTARTGRSTPRTCSSPTTAGPSPSPASWAADRPR